MKKAFWQRAGVLQDPGPGPVSRAILQKTPSLVNVTLAAAASSMGSQYTHEKGKAKGREPSS